MFVFPSHQSAGNLYTDSTYPIDTEHSRMNFGVGVGDVIAVGGLCWKVYKKCKDSAGKYAELSGEVCNLHSVVKEAEELLQQQVLTREQ